ncbi:MAG: choice-of-anchor J domain-containing protein [Bacteroidales bacterium]
MKKRNLLTSLFFSSVALLTAQTTTLPYHADWKYAEGGFEQDGQAGKPDSDHTLYNLGGWESTKTAGSRPFFIAISQGAPIANTMEFNDATQDPTQNTSWLISPAFDFSANTDKNISFKCGLEKLENRTSNLELLYSTDYAGDAKTATWVSVKQNLIPDTQAGLGIAKMETVNITLPIVEGSVVIAIKADKAEGKTAAAQAKIRVTEFAITETEKSTLITLPYEAAWHYKEEIVNADSSLNMSLDANAGLFNGNREFYNLGGWSLANTEGSRSFFLSKTKITGTDLFKPIPNTLEFLDDKQKTPVTTWIISPEIDFSGATDKYISLLCGKEKADQQSSNIDLVYSVNYAGDPEAATWTVISSKLIDAKQEGLNETTMTFIEEKLNLNAPKVVLAIRASKDGQEGGKQAKIRVKNLAVTLQSIETGIQDQLAENTISFYPNPVNETLHIANAESVEKLEIYSIAGQKQMEVAYPATTISVSHLAAGSYLARIQTIDGSVRTLQLIKK